MSKNNENVLIPCSCGIALMMCSLTAAIFLGTSYLITSQPGLDLMGISGFAVMLLLVGSVIGGYLVSYGFQRIVRGSNGAASGTQD